MRHGSNSRRTRRGGANRRPNPRTQTFDSNGPDVRIRGTAFQITEKYMTLAKDAAAAGDAVLAESYLQHAEHYQRIINSMTEQIQKSEQADGKEQKQKQAKAKTDKAAKGDVVAEGEEADGLRAILKADELPVAEKETEDKPKKVVRRKKSVETEKVADPV